MGITVALLLAPLAGLHAADNHATWIEAEDCAAQHGFRAANFAMSPAVESVYRGWKTVCLSNDLIDLQVLPDIGGRIIQFKLGGKEFLWVNPQLAGKLPPSNGLAADGGWFNIGGDKLWPAPQGWDNDRQWPGPPDAVLDGVVAEPLSAESSSGQTRLKGRWGVFAPGKVRAVFADARGRRLQALDLPLTVSPLKPVVLDTVAAAPTDAVSVKLVLIRADGQAVGELAKADLRKRAAAARWPTEKAWQWYNSQPWLVGFNYIPATAINTTEMWQADTFDPKTIDKELVLAEQAGFNCVRVFVQYLVWENDPEGLKQRMEQFLSIAKKHGLRTLFVLFDDCAFGTMTEPFLGKQPDVNPGEYANGWTPSPGPKRVQDRSAWPKQGVGAFHWGLVNGKTQTHFPWGSKAGAPEPKVWQHDIFRQDHTPYDAKELALFKEAIRKGTSNATEVAGQWPATKAWAWYSQRPWLVGCNFLPSTAVNDVEMWQKETFDAKTIDRELGWAQELGFSTVRVFLNFVVWREDAAGLKKRFAEFLKIADRHGISVMPILFDDCNFAGRVATAGKQPDPVSGVHNSQWVSSPPLAMVTDRSAWLPLEQYVKDMVGAFAQDRRIVVWDLYNEPGNGMGEKSQALMEAAFAWARQMKPIQPLTTGAWTDFHSPLSRRMMELSDIVSFHGYDPVPEIEAKLKICAAHGRPVLCTEWLVRRNGNTFERLLPLFRDHKIGCWNWGLVAGRTQTYFPWGSPTNAPEPNHWQHDILRADGTPFNAREAQFIKVIMGKLPASALPQRTALVPTAEKSPVPWRYTLEKPAGDWFKPDFNDAAWKRGAAPFGTEEPPFGRKPNTVWTSADLWLRREFELPPGKFTDLALLLHYDEDATVYINGVLAVKAGGHNAAYESFDITSEAQAALKPGKNVMAVHCHQTIGGQYLDLGIEGVPAEAK
jgi:hypothetical protein